MRIMKIIDEGLLFVWNIKFIGVVNKGRYGYYMGELIFRFLEWKNKDGVKLRIE